MSSTEAASSALSKYEEIDDIEMLDLDALAEESEDDGIDMKELEGRAAMTNINKQNDNSMVIDDEIEDYDSDKEEAQIAEIERQIKEQRQ